MSFKNLAYIKGCLCFEDRTSYANEEIKLSDRFSNLLHNLIYSSSADDSDIDDLIQVAHELKHLIQDLSLTSCHVEQEIMSHISMLCSLRSDLLKEGQSLLLLNKGGIINPFYLNESNVDPVVMLLCTYISFYFRYFLAKDNIPDSGKNLTAWTGKLFDDISLSYTDLLESHAHFQSLKTILDKVNHKLITPKLQPLNVSRYFPMKITDRGELLLDARQIKFNGRYFNPLVLFFSATRNSIWWGDIINYFNTSFPKLSNIHAGVDIEVNNFLVFYHMVMETALTLPSYGFLLDTKDDYNPVHRYVRILNFVSSLSRENVYGYIIGKFEFFYDECAAKFGWLSYKETLNTFRSVDKNTNIYEQCLYDAGRLRGELDYNIFMFVLGPPKIPLVLRNDNHLRISYADNKIFFADSPYKNLSDAFFRKYVRWENKELNIDEMRDLQGSVLKDIANKLCRMAVAKAYVTGEKLSCPLKSNECSFRCGICDDIKNLQLHRMTLKELLKSQNCDDNSCILLCSLSHK